LSLWAFDRAVAEIELKGRLREQAAVVRLHGLHTILPRLLSTSSTSVLLMYPRSINR
jgi:hypothetical protein